MAQPTWALGFGDAGWWSRLAQPNHHAWTEAEAQEQLQALTLPTDAPAPQALAGYGLLGRPGPQQAAQRWRRCVTGRPVRAVTMAFLAWGSTPLAAQGCTAWLVSWDKASGHRRHAVRHWVRQHHWQGTQGAVGVRVVVCQVPRKSPWRNPIAPQWVHGKCAVSEADRLLSADERAMRVYAYDGCEQEAHLVMPKKVA